MLFQWWIKSSFKYSISFILMPLEIYYNFLFGSLSLQFDKL
jgi:hypothetical protein